MFGLLWSLAFIVATVLAMWAVWISALPMFCIFAAAALVSFMFAGGEWHN